MYTIEFVSGHLSGYLPLVSISIGGQGGAGIARKASVEYGFSLASTTLADF